MREVEQWISEKVEEIAKSAVRNSVGKSYCIYGHVWEIPESVERWVVENRDKE